MAPTWPQNGAKNSRPIGVRHRHGSRLAEAAPSRYATRSQMLEQRRCPTGSRFASPPPIVGEDNRGPGERGLAGAAAQQGGRGVTSSSSAKRSRYSVEAGKVRAKPQRQMLRGRAVEIMGRPLIEDPPDFASATAEDSYAERLGMDAELRADEVARARIEPGRTCGGLCTREPRWTPRRKMGRRSTHKNVPAWSTRRRPATPASRCSSHEGCCR